MNHDELIDLALIEHDAAQRAAHTRGLIVRLSVLGLGESDPLVAHLHSNIAEYRATELAARGLQQ